MWSHDLGKDFTDREWHCILLNSYYTSSSTKLRFFQYRLITRRLTTNVQVSKYKEEQSSKCTFCNLVNETIAHLFWECNSVVKLWKAILRWMKYMLHLDMQMTREGIMLLNFQGESAKLINTIVVCTTQYIYSCKYYHKELNFSELMYRITDLCNIEKIVANRGNKYFAYYCKWQRFITM